MAKPNEEAAERLKERLCLDICSIQQVLHSIRPNYFRKLISPLPKTHTLGLLAMNFVHGIEASIREISKNYTQLVLRYLDSNR